MDIGKNVSDYLAASAKWIQRLATEMEYDNTSMFTRCCSH
jgi:hypothetical protein